MHFTPKNYERKREGKLKVDGWREVIEGRKF
jgi:hypothetical protein